MTPRPWLAGIANGSGLTGSVVTPSSHVPSATSSPTVTEAEPLFVSVTLALPAVSAGGVITTTGGAGAIPAPVAASAMPRPALARIAAPARIARMLTFYRRRRA